MNPFNTRISFHKVVEQDSDEWGASTDGYAPRLTSIAAKREVIRGALKDVATRETAISYYRFVIRASSASRQIEHSDRLIDGGKTHEIISVLESDDRREITIMTKRLENENYYG